MTFLVHTPEQEVAKRSWGEVKDVVLGQTRILYSRCCGGGGCPGFNDIPGSASAQGKRSILFKTGWEKVRSYCFLGHQ